MLRALGPLLTAMLATSLAGIVVPLILANLGLSPLLIIAFTLALLSVLLDGTITKLGFSRAIHEINPLLSFLGKRIGDNGAIVLTRIAGISVILYGLFWLKNAYMLFAIAWLFFMSIFASTVSLLQADFVSLAVNTNVRQDSHES